MTNKCVSHTKDHMIQDTYRIGTQKLCFMIGIGDLNRVSRIYCCKSEFEGRSQKAILLLQQWNYSNTVTIAEDVRKQSSFQPSVTLLRTEWE